jgi:hypothetical protein
MLTVETIGRIRREHLLKGKTIRRIARDLKLSRNTVRKILRSGETAFAYDARCSRGRSDGDPVGALTDWTVPNDHTVPSGRAPAIPPRPPGACDHPTLHWAKTLARSAVLG